MGRKTKVSATELLLIDVNDKNFKFLKSLDIGTKAKACLLRQM